MSTKGFYLFLFLLSAQLVLGQSPSADFIIPNRSCLEENMQIQNASNGDLYEWDMCTDNLLAIPSIHKLGLISELPFHHRDPFDRLIIAQGLVEQIIIITKDTIFEEYGVLIQW